MLTPRLSSDHQQAPGMAERSKTSSGAFYLWSAAANEAEAKLPRRARAAFSEIGLAACKALALLERALAPPHKPVHVHNNLRIRPQDFLSQP